MFAMNGYRIISKDDRDIKREREIRREREGKKRREWKRKRGGGRDGHLNGTSLILSLPLYR